MNYDNNTSVKSPSPSLSASALKRQINALKRKRAKLYKLEALSVARDVLLQEVEALQSKVSR